MKRGKIPEIHKRFAFTVLKDPSGVWKDLPMKHPKHPSDELCKEVDRNAEIADREELEQNENVDTSNTLKAKKTKRKSRKRERYEDDSEDERPRKKRRRNRKQLADSDEENDDMESLNALHCNPLPDFIDQMTGEQIVNPAISPHGYVLGYDSWI